MIQSVDMHIACSADGKFIVDCGVMLQSLFQNNPGQRIQVHFPHDQNADTNDLSRLQNIVESAKGLWNPLPISNEEFRAFPFTERFGYNAWYRILLPRLLPQLNRILYLDSDMLISDSLDELWNMDLSGHSVAAVTQPILSSMKQRLQRTLGITDSNHYFNSGVMLLDLDILRKNNTVSKILEFISNERAPMPWADQDPLNAVLHRQRLTLHPRWNCMTPLFHLPNRYLPFDAHTVAEATDHPAIVHFIGAYKPWHYLCRNPWAIKYFEYLAQTPWRTRPIEGKNLIYAIQRRIPEMWLHHLYKIIRRLSMARPAK